MSYGYRSPGRHLLFEDRHDTPIAAEYVPEAYRNESCITLVLQSTDHQFRDSFCRPHHTCGSNRLVGRDHYKILYSMPDRRTCGLPGANDVVFDSAENVSLHHGNMLVSCCMIDDRRPILGHHTLQIIRISHIANLRAKCEARKAFTEISVNVEQRSFCLIESN